MLPPPESAQLLASVTSAALALPREAPMPLALLGCLLLLLRQCRAGWRPEQSWELPASMAALLPRLGLGVAAISHRHGTLRAATAGGKPAAPAAKPDSSHSAGLSAVSRPPPNSALKITTMRAGAIVGTSDPGKAGVNKRPATRPSANPAVRVKASGNQLRRISNKPANAAAK